MADENLLGTEVNPRSFDVGATSPIGSVPGPTAPPPNLSSPGIAPQQAPTPAQVMSQQLQTADTQHHSALGKAFRSIMGNDVSYQINPQTGKMEQTETPQKPGQFWRGIIAATVLGGATAARSKAPGFIQGAAEGGEAVVDKSQQQDLLKRQQAQEQFKDQLAARSANTEEDLKRAQIAMHNAHTLHENQIMQREDYSFHKDVADHGKTQLQPFINADPTLVKFQDIPETQMTDLLKNNPDSQHLLWEPTGTRIVIGADGKPNVEATYSGVDPKGNVKVTTDQIDSWKKAGLDQIYGKATWDVLTKDKELPANTYMAINQKAQELTNKQLIDKKTKLDADKESAAIDLAKAQTKHFNAEAGKLWAEEKDKKMATEAFDVLSTGGDISKISIKGRKLLIDGLDSIIKTNVDELKALPKDPTTNQPVDQDKARELYGTMENYQKIVDRLYGIKTPEKPAAGGAAVPKLDKDAQDYVNNVLNDDSGKAMYNKEEAGGIIWDEKGLSLDQKVAVTANYDAVVPWSAVTSTATALRTTPELTAKRLKDAGLKVESAPAPTQKFPARPKAGETEPFPSTQD